MSGLLARGAAAAVAAACVLGCTDEGLRGAPSDARPPVVDAAADGGATVADSAFQDGAGHDTDAAVGPPCSVAAPTVCPSSYPLYADVAPIFDRRCNTCHNGDDGGPWPLSDYLSVEAWAGLIQYDLTNCSMPPMDAGAGLTGDELNTLLTWLACNAPQ